MSKELLAEDFTNGFNYSVKSGEMTLDFFCDCCGHDVKVSKTFDPNVEINQHELFEELKKDMCGKFHRCEQCNFLICQGCYDNRDVKCAECSICVHPA